MREKIYRTRYMIGIFSIDTIFCNPYMTALLERERKEVIKWIKIDFNNSKTIFLSIFGKKIFFIIQFNFITF